jgi:hypothetical protein
MATVHASLYDGLRGGKLQIGEFTINPDTINSDSQVETTIALDGAAPGDVFVVSPRQMDAGLVVTSARITATDEAGVALYNASGGAVDGAEQTYDYYILKRNES